MGRPKATSQPAGETVILPVVAPGGTRHADGAIVGNSKSVAFHATKRNRGNGGKISSGEDDIRSGPAVGGRKTRYRGPARKNWSHSRLIADGAEIMRCAELGQEDKGPVAAPAGAVTEIWLSPLRKKVFARTPLKETFVTLPL